MIVFLPLFTETSDTEIEDEIESTRVFPAKKRKNRFRDTGLEVREVIEYRFIKLEEKILSSQTQGGAPANTQTLGADPFWTPYAAAAATAPASVSARAPVPTPASTEAPASVSTSGLAPSCSAAYAPYHSRASATAHIGGPANATKTRPQTKDDVVFALCNIIIARVAQEMKQKLKIATVAMVVVGAIIGIWTSL
ncbi:hypothetical protein HID58_086348, partial [Brassica napus]